jgi:hypothetical protein
MNDHTAMSQTEQEDVLADESMKGLRFSKQYCLKALTDWTLFPQLLNIHEASWLTQVPVKTLYKWHSDGVLEGVAKTIGKQLRFDRDALLSMWKDETKKTAK